MSPSTNAIATSPLAVEEFSDSPITWRQANKYIQTGRLSSLLRSRQQLQRYDYWIQDCLGRYHSVGDYIKHIVLGWPVSWVTDDSVPAGPTAVLSNNAADPNPRQRLRAYLPSGGNCNASDEETIQIVLRQNDFPYNFHQDVIHYVLWSNRDNLDSQFVERYVGEAFPRQRHQWLWFCNPSSRKSIKDVWHVHILLHNPVFTSSPPGVFKSTASISGSAGALLDTPCMVLYTRRLGVPHLTVDIVEKLPASINNPLAMHFSFGHLPLDREINAESSRLTPFRDAIGIATFTDSHQPPALQSFRNGDDFVIVASERGQRKLLIKDFAEMVSTASPATTEWQFIAAPMDSIPPKMSLKRTRKSVDRTLQYLDSCLAVNAQSTRPVKYLGIIEGGVDLEERRRSAEETAKRSSAVAGFLIDGLLCGESDEQFQSVLKVVSKTLPRDKPRFLFGPITDLSKFLVAINAGVDVFDSYYACNLADQAKALNLQYDNGRLTGYQLLDFTNPGGSEGVEVEYDQQPLMDGCPCYACTEQYKQCYIQHLFNVHEILGLTLLTVHNLTQLQLFFGAVRQSIREGYFNELKTSFHRI